MKVKALQPSEGQGPSCYLHLAPAPELTRFCCNTDPAQAFDAPAMTAQAVVSQSLQSPTNVAYAPSAAPRQNM